ncbi:MAG: hypothetical protein EZS28_032503 [Streblomastix strix]|uniref:Uncharacterized protein n=1 Tax=Streblomastix strix TaxID=222440 RepID=A0A5J4UPM0_9EUKA|nr:MAG: hypothetical protein EZS28_032503 [Streblomastix strix]
MVGICQESWVFKLKGYNYNSVIFPLNPRVTNTIHAKQTSYHQQLLWFKTVDDAMNMQTKEQIEIQKEKQKQRILRSRQQHEEWIKRRYEQKQKEKEMEKMKEQDPERNAMWRMDMSPMSEQGANINKVGSQAYLQFLKNQIQDNNGCKQVIQIPKLLQSLSALSRFKIGIHIGQELDQMRLEIRCNSRWCLRYIQVFGDEQIQSELVNNGYGRMMSTAFCTAGGKGEEQDEEIRNGLINITDFLIGLHAGRIWQPSFQPLPLLARNTEEQIEEEGANEELDTQMNNNGMNGHIRNWANEAKAMTLNHFIYWD